MLSNNNIIKKKYLKYKNKYLKLLEGGRSDFFYVSDFMWFSDIEKATALPTYASKASMQDDNMKLFVNNLSYLTKNGATIIKESVDGFNIKESITENIDMILFGSPHWTGSDSKSETTFVEDNDIIKSYYTIELSESGKFPKINCSYDKKFSEYYRTEKYLDHIMFKGGVFHYLINKYSEKIIVIPFCDHMSEDKYKIFHDGYSIKGQTPYSGIIYYCYIDTPGYIPSNSHSFTKRCDADNINSLVYIPEEYADMSYQFFEQVPGGIKLHLYEFMKELHSNKKKKFLFLGEHICNLSRNSL